MSTVHLSGQNSNARQSWYAVKVRSRAEIAVAEVLRTKEYDVLVPHYTQVRRYSDRVRRVTSALFPGYVFVCADSEYMLPLLSTEGVSYVVRRGGNFEPLASEEVAVIQALSRMDARQSESCEPCNYFTVGQRVRIQLGPLAGIEGVLVRIRNKERVVVSVDSLHSSVSVEIEHDHLQLLGARQNPLGMPAN